MYSQVVKRLKALNEMGQPGAAAARHGLQGPDLTRRYFACDTEVSGIDITEESPVGHGTVICFSIYAGPDADFRIRGEGKPQPRIWVDLAQALAGVQMTSEPRLSPEVRDCFSVFRERYA